MPQASQSMRFEIPLPSEPWKIVAILALGTLFWLPRMQERLPGAPAACPAQRPETLAVSPPESVESPMSARLTGALGDAWLSLMPQGASIERTEEPLVRWVLCPLSCAVGACLAFLGLRGFYRRRRRPKAAAMYAIAAALGLWLTSFGLRVATYEQTIRFSAATVELETRELWGLWPRRHAVHGVGAVSAWRRGGRYVLYAVPAKDPARGCAALLPARWVEPELLAVLNKALR